MHSVRSVAFVLLLTFGATPQLAIAQQQQDEGKNPIGEFFRGLDRGIKKEADDVRLANLGRDQLDTRPPQSRDLARKFDQARLLLKDEKWHDAVEVLQFLLMTEDDVFYFDRRHQLHSIKSEAEKLLANLPEAAVRNDTNRSQPIAEAELSAAFKIQSEENLANVAENYLRTPAGRNALESFALRTRDRGQLQMAAFAFARLANATKLPARQTRYARMAQLAAHESGNLALTNEISDILPVVVKDLALGGISTLDNSESSIDSNGSMRLFPESIDTKIDPVLVPSWSTSMIERFTLSDFASRIVASYRKNSSILPTFIPAIANGKLILRTLRSLQVRDLKSGTLIWENRATDDLESVLDEKLGTVLRSFNSGSTSDQNALSNLLLRDQVTRAITTDGNQLFVIEGNEILSERARTYSWRRATTNTANVEKMRTNELVAYELDSGNVRWRLGGRENDKPFTRPLAGTYFFGPPTVSGSELFVVGESDGEVKLHVIDPRTGEPNWSQVISVPSSDVTNDVVRRLWACQPVVSGHLVVCPTTCGWLVAVDRVTKRLAWTVRYGARRDQDRRLRGGNPIQSLQSLNTRWSFSAPICTGKHVLFTPPEFPDEFGNTTGSCLCINLYSGEVEWKEENRRENQMPNLYLAGVDGDHAIFLSKNSVTARKISEQGEIAWKIPLKLDEEFVSGRSVMLNRSLLVPVGKTQLVEVDLDSGEQKRVFSLPENGPDFGNLVYSDGYIISASTHHLEAFPINEMIDTNTQPNSNLVAEISKITDLLSRSKNENALVLIRKLLKSPQFKASSHSIRKQVHQLHWNALTRIADSDSSASADALAEMSRFEMTPQQRVVYQQLMIDSKLSVGEWKQSLDLCFELLEEALTEETVTEAERTIGIDVWIASRIRQMVQQQTVSAVDEALRDRWSSVVENVGQVRLARVTESVPVGQQLEFALAEEAFHKGAVSEAIVRYQRLTTTVDKPIKSRVWTRLAMIFESLEAWEDARDCWEQVLNHSSVDELDDQQSKVSPESRLKEVAKRLQGEKSTTNFNSTDPWSTIRGGVRRQDDQVSVIKVAGESLKTLQNRRSLFLRQQQRVRIEDGSTGELLWSLPIRRAPHLRRYSIVGMLHSGAMTYVVNQGVLHALMNFDNQIAWTFTPDLWGEAAGQLRRPIARSNMTMSDPKKFRLDQCLQSFQTPAGMVVAASPHAVLIFDDRLRALDPLTGEFLWSQTQFDSKINAIPLRDRFLIIRNNESPVLLNSSDGSKIPTDWGREFSLETLLIDGTDRITLHDVSEDGQRRWELQRSEIDSGDVLWTRSIENTSLVSQVDPQTLAVLSEDGRFFKIDLIDGSLTPLAQVPSEQMKKSNGTYCFADAERIYLLSVYGSVSSSRMSLASLRTPGMLFACDRAGGMLWSLDTESLDEDIKDAAVERPRDDPRRQTRTRRTLRLVTQEIEDSPLIIFADNQQEFRGTMRLSHLRLIGLRKETGEQVINWERLSNSGGFSYLHVDPDERSIDLWTQSDRIKIQQIDSSAEQGEADE